jgi:hypothetical protein
VFGFIPNVGMSSLNFIHFVAQSVRFSLDFVV